MISKSISSAVRVIPNFPKSGINFIDIVPILLNHDLSNEIIESFIKNLKGKKIDAIAGIESRGFLFGFALANKLNIPFLPIRKSGKLPGETYKYKYDLEYGSNEIEIQKNLVKKNSTILIHDDLLATGGTALAAAELIKKSGALIGGFAFIIDLGLVNLEKVFSNYTDLIVSLKKY